MCVVFVIIISFHQHVVCTDYSQTNPRKQTTIKYFAVIVSGTEIETIYHLDITDYSTILISIYEDLFSIENNHFVMGNRLLGHTTVPAGPPDEKDKV